MVRAASGPSLWRGGALPSVLLLLVVLVVATGTTTSSSTTAAAVDSESWAKTSSSSGKGGDDNNNSNNSTLSLYSLLSLCHMIPFTPPSFFNISSIDPRTGTVIAEVYNTTLTCQLLSPVAPVGDSRTKKAYIAAYHRESWFEVWGEPSLDVFDMSDPNKVVLQQRIPLPTAPQWAALLLYSNAALDPVTDSVWLVSETQDAFDQQADATFLVKVDLRKGVAYNITAIPVPNLLTTATVGGPNHGGTINVKSRKLILPLQTHDPRGGATYDVMAEFDLDQHKFTSISNTNWTANALVWDSSSGNTYGFIFPSHTSGTVSYGILEPGTGEWRIIKKYPSNFRGAGRMVIDSSAGVIYGSFDGYPHQSYVVISIPTGDVLASVPRPLTSPEMLALFGV